MHKQQIWRKDVKDSSVDKQVPSRFARAHNASIKNLTRDRVLRATTGHDLSILTLLTRSSEANLGIALEFLGVQGGRCVLSCLARYHDMHSDSVLSMSSGVRLSLLPYSSTF